MPTMTAAREAMLAKYTTSRETHHRSDQSNRFGKEQANLVVHLGQEHAPKRPKHADYVPFLKGEVGGYWLVQTFLEITNTSNAQCSVQVKPATQAPPVDPHSSSCVLQGCPTHAHYRHPTHGPVWDSAPTSHAL